MRSIFNRSSVMFALGASGFLHELIRGGAERPFLLALCGALMGLPFVLAADTKWGRPDGEEDDERWTHLP